MMMMVSAIVATYEYEMHRFDDSLVARHFLQRTQL